MGERERPRLRSAAGRPGSSPRRSAPRRPRPREPAGMLRSAPGRRRCRRSRDGTRRARRAGFPGSPGRSRRPCGPRRSRRALGARSGPRSPAVLRAPGGPCGPAEETTTSSSIALLADRVLLAVEAHEDVVRSPDQGQAIVGEGPLKPVLHELRDVRGDVVPEAGLRHPERARRRGRHGGRRGRRGRRLPHGSSTARTSTVPSSRDEVDPGPQRRPIDGGSRRKGREVEAHEPSDSRAPGSEFLTVTMVVAPPLAFRDDKLSWVSATAGRVSAGTVAGRERDQRGGEPRAGPERGSPSSGSRSAGFRNRDSSLGPRPPVTAGNAALPFNRFTSLAPWSLAKVTLFDARGLGSGARPLPGQSVRGQVNRANGHAGARIGILPSIKSHIESAT